MAGRDDTRGGGASGSILFGVGHMLLGIATYRARALAMLTLEQIGSIFLGMDALWAVGPVMLGVPSPPCPLSLPWERGR
ncbi:MAG: hypothetical protein U0893_20545 [Chloroflexota bacterium]